MPCISGGISKNASPGRREHGNEKENDATEPKPDEWAWLDAIERPVDEDFLKAASEKPEEQEREGLDDLFG